MTEEKQHTDLTGLNVDTLVDIVGHPIRRLVLARTADGAPVPFEELVAALVATETDRSAEEIEIALRHVHLPKLADSDVLDVDWEREVVRYRPDERLERLLDAVREIERACHPDEAD